METEFFKNNDSYEILKDNGSKRLIKRTFRYADGKEARIDYAIERKMYIYGKERWTLDYYNVSKSKGSLNRRRY